VRLERGFVWVCGRGGGGGREGVWVMRGGGVTMGVGGRGVVPRQGAQGEGVLDGRKFERGEGSEGREGDRVGKGYSRCVGVGDEFWVEGGEVGRGFVTTAGERGEGSLDEAWTGGGRRGAGDGGTHDGRGFGFDSIRGRHNKSGARVGTVEGRRRSGSRIWSGLMGTMERWGVMRGGGRAWREGVTGKGWRRETSGVTSEG
jgi:hypothetical protein